LNEGSARLNPSVTFSEKTAEGIAPAFQEDGFARPSEVSLVEQGRMVGSLVNPRTAREFTLAHNGANASETPESLEMEGGTLTGDQALELVDTGLYIGNLHYLNFSDRNACRLTGMTRFASFWVEGGRIVAPVDVMRFDDTVFRLLGDELIGLTAEQELLVSSDTYHQRNVASARLPGAVVREMAFTL
jgi:predicted Zn-dependent protease